MGCLEFFSLKQSIYFKWKCPKCHKPIKKGVAERIDELADLSEGKHPIHRPEYKYLIPLNEIIALALGIKQNYSIKVQGIWKKYADRFKNEINVLLYAEIKDLKEIDEKIGTYIQYFRENKIRYIPGGAGVYGQILDPESENIKEPFFEKNKEKQKGLNEF